MSSRETEQSSPTGEDLENKKPHSGAAESLEQSSPELDPAIISFDGPEDLENPRNWSRNYKWFLVALLSAMATMVYVFHLI
jgi:hypothetical protein